MDKPMSMSVKDYLMRIMSIRENIPLKTIEAVVDHQFTEARKAMEKTASIELSGFCKFIFNHKKAQKKLDLLYSKEIEHTNTLLDSDLTEAKKKLTILKLESNKRMINQVKNKIDGLKTNGGGMEEQVDSSNPDEGIH